MGRAVGVCEVQVEIIRRLDAYRKALASKALHKFFALVMQVALDLEFALEVERTRLRPWL